MTHLSTAYDDDDDDEAQQFKQVDGFITKSQTKVKEKTETKYKNIYLHIFICLCVWERVCVCVLLINMSFCNMCNFREVGLRRLDVCSHMASPYG